MKLRTRVDTGPRNWFYLPHEITKTLASKLCKPPPPLQLGWSAKSREVKFREISQNFAKISWNLPKCRFRKKLQISRNRNSLNWIWFRYILKGDCPCISIAYAACPCWWGLSMSMLHVHVNVACLCWCCMSTSMLHVHVHALCPCWFCL